MAVGPRCEIRRLAAQASPRIRKKKHGARFRCGHTHPMPLVVTKSPKSLETLFRDAAGQAKPHTHSDGSIESPSAGRSVHNCRLWTLRSCEGIAAGGPVQMEYRCGIIRHGKSETEAQS